MNTFDRYLLKRYLHTFVVLFVTMYGLFIVIDGFTNVDAFQSGQESTAGVLKRMADYYTYQSSMFFDMTGSILSIISVVVALALMQRNSEIHPILAAGVPTYRLIVPFLIGALLVTSLVVANQEWIIPRIAHHLRAPRSEDKARSQSVQPIYDHATHLLIAGKELDLASRTVRQAEFVLPVPEIAEDLTTLKAETARYYDRTSAHPAGWRLMDVNPPYSHINLTPQGRRLVLPLKNPKELFVVTDVSFSQLSNRAQEYTYASTPELLSRIKNPAFSVISVRGVAVHLHTRLLQPVWAVVAVLLAVPLVVRRESRSLVGNLAICAGVLGIIFGLNQGVLYLGRVNLISPSLAAWSPAIFAGSLGAWLSNMTQT